MALRVVRDQFFSYFSCVLNEWIDTRRIGRVTENESSPESALHVFEVLAPLPHWDSNAKQILWPNGATRLDGVIICYDASDFHSFSPVENLLREYHLVT
jgi:hypothetical protein